MIVPPSERDNGRRLVREARIATPAVRTATRRAQAGILVVALGDNRSFDPEWQTGGHPATAVAVPNYTPIDPIDGVFHGDYDEQTYGTSWLIVEHLVNTYGLPRLNAFYTELAKSPEDPTAREKTLHKHFKITASALVTAVKN